MRKAIIIRHVAFEDEGSLGEVLEAEGIRVQVLEPWQAREVDPREPLLLAVLGGPLSANDTEDFPFLDDEKRLLAARLQARLPTVGICLGAQLMAAALGCRVYKGAQKELGWGPLSLTLEGRGSVLKHLEGVPVLHWHGETFELPRGSTWLASTAAFSHQAFALGNYGLALQFHPEVTTQGLERWFIGHVDEIRATPRVSVASLRRDTLLNAPRLHVRAFKFWKQWLVSCGALEAIAA